MGWGWLKKVGKIAAIAAPIIAAPFTGGVSLAAIGALSGAAGAKLSGAGWKGSLLGAGLGGIPGLGGSGSVAKRAVGESISAAAKRALVNPQTLARLAAPLLPGKAGQVAQYASMFLPGARAYTGAQAAAVGVRVPASAFGVNAQAGGDPFAATVRGSLTRGFGGGAPQTGLQRTLAASNAFAPVTGGSNVGFSLGDLFKTGANDRGLFTGRDLVTLGAGGASAYANYRGSKAQERGDTASLDYQRTLDAEMRRLLAAQRLEDQQREDARELSEKERWDAEQAAAETRWNAQEKRVVDQYNARETRLSPYRDAGRASLARIANVQAPTITPYAPSMVYRG